MAAPSASKRAVVAPEVNLATAAEHAPPSAEDFVAAARAILRAGLPKTGYVVVALIIFVLALQFLTTGASGVENVLSTFAVDGPVNLFGFGWLGAYAMLSGSPVAATSLSLYNGGAISELETLAMISGSRFGASFMVLLVGLLYYVRHQRNPDGLYVGVVALLTTFTIYTPSLVGGVIVLNRGWLDGAEVGAPPGVVRLTDDTVGWLAGHAADVLPGVLVFLVGAGALLLAFQLFDQVLPNLEPPGPRLERILSFFHRPLAMFAMGGLVTLLTMSVAISLTLLVPLSMKGIVRRHGLVPFVMGANITTFIDTLFAAVVLDAPQAVTVVIVQVVMTAAVSLAVLLFLYQPYQRVILGLAHRITANRRNFGAFMAAIFVVPVVLMAV